MTEESALLAEIMLQSAVFCAAVEEAAVMQALPNTVIDPLRLKISQCQGILAQLQETYESDRLEVTDPAVCASFRHLLMALLWVNFLGRDVVDYRMYRSLVCIESSLTYALITRPNAMR